MPLVGDAIFWLLIVIAGFAALSPVSGLAAARDWVVARRRERSRLARIERTEGAVWARHARRQAAGIRNVAPHR